MALGGASLSLESIQAACLGALAAIPLALFKAATWSDGARCVFPPLAEAHQYKLDELRPLLANMSPAQVMGAYAHHLAFLLAPRAMARSGPFAWVGMLIKGAGDA
jgi:hypothetical protein